MILREYRKEKCQERVLNEIEASNLSDIEFKIIVIRMPKYFKKNYKELNEDYLSMNKDIETMRKNQEEMKNVVSEMKNTLEVIKNRLDEAGD